MTSTKRSSRTLFWRERTRRRRRGIKAAFLISSLALGSGMGTAAPANADAGTARIEIHQTSEAAQPAGSTFQYSIAFTCSAFDAATCLRNGTIRIPLGIAGGWDVEFPVNLPDGVRSMTKQGNGADGYSIVVDLADLVGASDAIMLDFHLKSPIGLADGTSWDLTPVLTADTREPLTGNTATSSATSSPSPFEVTLRDRADKTYYVGQTITWWSMLKCLGGSPGQQWPTEFVVSFSMPEGVEFTSLGNGSDWEYDPQTRTASAVRGGEVCGDASGAFWEVSAAVTDGVTSGTILTAEMTVTAVWPNSARTAQSATWDVQVVDREDPKGEFYKDATGPLRAGADRQSNNHGTFPGAGRGVSSFTVGVRGVDGEAGDLRFSVWDDLPCLDQAESGFIYQSVDEGDICTRPAWHLTHVTPSTGANAPLGSAPAVTATLVDGSEMILPFAEGEWAVPGDALGKIARVRISEVGANTQSGNNTRFNLLGYADETLENGDVIRNFAEVFSNSQINARAESQTRIQSLSDLFILSEPQIGVSKSSYVDGAVTKWQIVGSVHYPRALEHDIVIADLLPADSASPIEDGAMTVIGEIAVPVQVLENFAGTGRTLLRWAITPEILAHSGFDNGISTSFMITYPAITPYAGTYTNDVAILLSPPVGLDMICTRDNEVEQDPLDLDGRPETQRHCAASATVTVASGPGVSSLRLQKLVKGDADGAFRGSPAVGHVSDEGKAQYELSLLNTDPTHSLTDVVLYDVFPRVGDTGVTMQSSGIPRGSEFSIAFDGISSRSPGTIIEYSTSENPCRDEVFPNSANPDCADDWTETAPQVLSSVTAIRASSTDSIGYLEGLDVTIDIVVPLHEQGGIAWNSAAATASNRSGAPAMPAVEAAKVGVTRAGHADLTFSKTVDSETAAVGDLLTYTIAVENMGTLPVRDVLITDSLPHGMELVSVSVDGETSGQTIEWALGDLHPGDRKVVRVEAKVTAELAGATATNSVVAMGSTQDGVMAGVPTADTMCADKPGAACASTKIITGAGATGDLAETGSSLPILVLTTSALALITGGLLLAVKRRRRAMRMNVSTDR